MTDDINLTYDVGVRAFDDASGVVSTTDDDGISFSWDEEHVVRVDAPSDLNGAFDTERFYKIEDATVARPIKQPYLMGDELKWYKKPADELRKAAWSFDNAPFTLSHPDTGMVKDVNDVHGFWRNVRYDSDDDRLQADLYVPTNDDEALAFIEENQDVSPGFYNRVRSDYDGDTGDLTDDDDLDGFQVDMYGNHIAGVDRGRCSGADGCGLDDQDHGEIVGEPETRDSGRDVSDIDESSDSSDCGPCDTMSNTDDNTDDGNSFDVPDLSIDALAEKNEAVRELTEELDSYEDTVEELREDLDETEQTIEEAFDAAENFTVSLDDDECVCEAVEDLVEDLDEKVEEVEHLEDELEEYREEEVQEKLDRLEDLGADREEWDDENIESLDEEIQRREEVLDAAPNTSVKDIDDTTDSTDEDEESSFGRRTFGRGHGA